MIDQSGEAQVPNYPLLCHSSIMKTQPSTDILSVHRLTTLCFNCFMLQLNKGSQLLKNLCYAWVSFGSCILINL